MCAAMKDEDMVPFPSQQTDLWLVSADHAICVAPFCHEVDRMDKDDCKDKDDPGC